VTGLKRLLTPEQFNSFSGDAMKIALLGLLIGVAGMSYFARVSRAYDVCLVSCACEGDGTKYCVVGSGVSGGSPAGVGQNGTFGTNSSCAYVQHWFWPDTACGGSNQPGSVDCTGD
jgi:hypothetical protein